jgi:predicted RNA binding protein YcfA (HicA-like mRNA interferase family)
MKVKEVLKRLKDDGWHIVRTRGDHRQLHHDDKPGTVTVAGHLSDEVDPGTLGNIWRQAGLGKRP